MGRSWWRPVRREADWALNLDEDPACRFTIGERTVEAVAEPLDAGEHAAAIRWPDPALRDLGRGTRPRTVVPAPACRGVRAGVGAVTVSVDIETRIGRPVDGRLRGAGRGRALPGVADRVGHRRGRVALDPGPLAAGSRLRIRQTVAGRSTVLDGRDHRLLPGRGVRRSGARDTDGVIDRDRCAPCRRRHSPPGCAGRSGSGCRCATGCSNRWSRRRPGAPPPSIVEALKRRLESVAG